VGKGGGGSKEAGEKRRGVPCGLGKRANEYVGYLEVHHSRDGKEKEEKKGKKRFVKKGREGGGRERPAGFRKRQIIPFLGLIPY